MPCGFKRNSDRLSIPPVKGKRQLKIGELKKVLKNFKGILKHI